MDATRPVLTRVADAAGRAVRKAAVMPRTIEERRRQRAARWLVVTVDRTPEDVESGLPSGLRDTGAEVRVRAAPGERGTELAARPRDSRRDEVRKALREAKQLLEVGEVLRLDPQPAGERTSGPAGQVIDAVARRAGRKGVL